MAGAGKLLPRLYLLIYGYAYYDHIYYGYVGLLTLTLTLTLTPTRSIAASAGSTALSPRRTGWRSGAAGPASIRYTPRRTARTRLAMMTALTSLTMASGAPSLGPSAAWPLPMYHPHQAAHRSRGCSGRRRRGGCSTPASERRRRPHLPSAAARAPLGYGGPVTLTLPPSP